MASTSINSLSTKERKEISLELSEIAKSLKYRRIDKGYTQEHLAELVGTVPESIRKIENENRYPSLIMLLRITRILGVKITFS